MISGVIFTVNTLASSSLSEPEPEPEPEPDSEPDSEPDPDPDSEPDPDPDLAFLPPVLDVCFFECVEGTDAAGVEIHSTSASRISLYFESNEIEAPIMNMSLNISYIFLTHIKRGVDSSIHRFIPIIRVLNHLHLLYYRP